MGTEKINLLSVDQINNKHPSVSPYVYCTDYPIIIIESNVNNFMIVS
jgi:hypothetical protein